MNKRERIKNSIRAYVMGDALGVPYEFKKEGTFKCDSFTGFGTYMQKPGTWSDDTSILLCLMDAFCSIAKQEDRTIEKYKTNIMSFYKKGAFTIDGIFDIGCQTVDSIESNFEKRGMTDRMGNGALFYSLPFALIPMKKNPKIENFEEFCKVTHNNNNCFEYGFMLACHLRFLFNSNEPLVIKEIECENKGDVINTFALVQNQYLKLINSETTLFEDLCAVVNLGNDTDTNAALFGALIGTRKRINEEDWKKVRKYDYIDKCIESLLNSLEVA